MCIVGEIGFCPFVLSVASVLTVFIQIKHMIQSSAIKLKISLNNFVNSLHAHAGHVICYERGIQPGQFIYKYNTHHAITLSSSQACACEQSNAYFEGTCISLERVPCRFSILAPGCCPSMLLQSECETVSRVKNFSLKYFCEQKKIREICEIEDPQKFSAIW